MNLKRMIVFAVTVALLAVAGPTFAHHGTASYETDKMVSITGTVTDFSFGNPHVLITIDAKDQSGAPVKWQGELTSPNHLSRMGWSRTTLKPGDQITMSGMPAKSGASSMWIKKIVKADGEALNLGGGGDN